MILTIASHRVARFRHWLAELAALYRKEHILTGQQCLRYPGM